VSRNANGLAHPAAIGARAWTRIAPAQPPLAGHTALAGAESTGEGIETLDRGPCPGRFRGRGLGRDRGQGIEIIIMGDTPGRAQGRGLGSEAAAVDALTRGHVLALILVQGPVLCHVHDRGRSPAIGEAVIENAHAALAPEVGPRAAVAAAVESASGEGREVARRMCVFDLVFDFAALPGYRASAEGEEGEAEKWDGIGCCVGRSVGKIWGH
jgi:hypothetical protein